VRVLRHRRDSWPKESTRCRAPTNERQFDHIEPDSLGGANDEKNTQLLCRKCNRGFSDKLKENFKQLNRLGRNPCGSQ